MQYQERARQEGRVDRISLENTLTNLFKDYAFQKAVAITGIILLISLLLPIQLNPANYPPVFTDTIGLLEMIGLFLAFMVLFWVLEAGIDRIKYPRIFPVQYLVASVFILAFVMAWFALFFVGFIGPHNIVIYKTTLTDTGFITNTSLGELQIFNSTTRQIIATVDGLDRPTFLSINHNATLAYVVNQGNGTTSEINLNNKEIIRSIQNTGYPYSPKPPLIISYVILFLAVFGAAKLVPS